MTGRAEQGPTPWPRRQLALADAARAPRLLVVCDFDGTIAPIVDDPSTAAPDPQAIDHLRRLSTLDATYVALVSGRSRAQLAVLSGLGAERPEVAAPASGAVGDLIDRVRAVTRPYAGVELEPKPYGVAVHVRRADQPAEALEAVAEVAHASGAHVLHGKLVIELSLVRTAKGDAVRALIGEHGADRVVIVGDDLTDESAFAVAGEDDVSVKVGAGETLAHHRVDDVTDVVRLLRELAELRATWASSPR